jgi:predicted sugar kinase
VGVGTPVHVDAICNVVATCCEYVGSLTDVAEKVMVQVPVVAELLTLATAQNFCVCVGSTGPRVWVLAMIGSCESSAP